MLFHILFKFLVNSLPKQFERCTYKCYVPNVVFPMLSIDLQVLNLNIRLSLLVAYQETQTNPCEQQFRILVLRLKSYSTVRIIMIFATHICDVACTVTLHQASDRFYLILMTVNIMCY